MAVNRISPKINAYRAIAKPGSIPANEVASVNASVPVKAALAQPQVPVENRPAPYVNMRGETIGTVVDTAV